MATAVPLPELHPCHGAFHIDTLELDHVFLLSDEGWVLYSPVGVAVPLHLHRRPHIEPVFGWGTSAAAWKEQYLEAKFISTQ